MLSNVVAFKEGRLTVSVIPFCLSEIKERECSLISMSLAVAGTKAKENDR